ncbi:hypothetical protein V8E53_004182 [Lactarius tabidus]
MAYFQPLELEMDMEAAMRGVPIIAVMLVPPNISRVVITLKDSCRERISAARSSCPGPESSPRAITGTNGERERDPKSSSSTRETTSVAGAKRPFEDDDNTSEGPSTRTKTEAGASRAEAGPPALKVIAKPHKPQHLPENEVLVVVPPMPKSLYEELTDDSLTEPESSENERDIRKNEMKASN